MEAGKSAGACGDTGAVDKGVIVVALSVPKSEIGERANVTEGDAAQEYSGNKAVGLCALIEPPQLSRDELLPVPMSVSHFKSPANLLTVEVAEAAADGAGVAAGVAPMKRSV